MARYVRDISDMLGFDAFDRHHNDMDVDGRITACACNCNNITTAASSIDSLDPRVKIDANGIIVNGSSVATHNDLSRLSNDISMLNFTVTDIQNAIEDLQKALTHEAGGGLRRSDLRTLRVG